MIRKNGWLGLALLAGVTAANAAVQLGDGRVEADAVGMAGLASDPSMTAIGVGINGVYSRAYSETLNFGIGGSVALPVLETKDDDSGVYGGSALLGLEATSGGRSGLFFSFNRLYIHQQKPGFELTAGRFLHESPLISANEGYRMAPDAVEGVTVVLSDKAPDTKFVLGYINAFSGPSSGSMGANGTEKGSFAAMSDAILAEDAGGNSNVDNMGVLTAAALYENNESEISAQGWLYLMPTIKSSVGKGNMTLLYADGSKSFPTGAHRSTVSAQVLVATFGDDFDGMNHTIIGAMYALEASDTLSFEAAVNSVSGDGGLMEPWGTNPAFAGGYEASIAGLVEGQAIRLGVTAKLGDLNEAIREAEATCNLINASGDATEWGADTAATYLEGVVAATIKESIEGDARLLISGGDAEGTALLFRAGYRF